MAKGISHIEITHFGLSLGNRINPGLGGAIAYRMNMDIHIMCGRCLDQPNHLVMVIESSYAFIPGLVHIIIQHPRGVPLDNTIGKDLSTNHLYVLAVIFLCLLRYFVHILFRCLGIVINETAAEGIHLQLAFIVELLVGTGVMLGQKLVTGVIHTRITVCKCEILETKQFLLRLC